MIGSLDVQGKRIVTDQHQDPALINRADQAAEKYPGMTGQLGRSQDGVDIQHQVGDTSVSGGTGSGTVGVRSQHGYLVADSGIGAAGNRQVEHDIGKQHAVDHAVIGVDPVGLGITFSQLGAVIYRGKPDQISVTGGFLTDTLDIRVSLNRSQPQRTGINRAVLNGEIVAAVELQSIPVQAHVDVVGQTIGKSKFHIAVQLLERYVAVVTLDLHRGHSRPAGSIHAEIKSHITTIDPGFGKDPVRRKGVFGNDHGMFAVQLKGVDTGKYHLVGSVQAGFDIAKTTADKGVVDVIDEILQTGIVQSIVAVDDHRTFHHVITLVTTIGGLIQAGTEKCGVVVGIDRRHHHVKGDVVRQNPHGNKIVLGDQLKQRGIAAGEFRAAGGDVDQSQKVGAGGISGYFNVHGIAGKYQHTALITRRHVKAERIDDGVDIG